MITILNHKEAYFIIGLFTFFFISCKKNNSDYQAINLTSNNYNNIAHYYSNYNSIASKKLIEITNLSNIDSIKQSYLTARKSFKYLEPILAFVDSENYKYLNQPNILKIEEDDATDVKIKIPTGFQVLEEEIYADETDLTNIKKHAKKTYQRLNFVEKNLRTNNLKDYHILWIVRDQLIRIALTGITGFDSPMLENSLQEAKYSYESIENILKLNTQFFSDKELLNKWLESINETKNFLNGDFNSFNRYEFIKTHTHKQLGLWNNTVEDWQVTFPFTKALNNELISIFSNKTFNQNYFSTYKTDDSLKELKIELGKQLFYDKELSSNKTISCGTCHDPSKAFTDGLKISKGVTRNSPTLTYASLQKGFFYDNRAGSLEGQIVSVVKNENEFHSSLEELENHVKNNNSYITYFQKAYEGKSNEANIRNALATYIRSLNPFNSKFDRNINGLEHSLTNSEIEGFNLFMGKAKCATCHFAPTFNGTVPVAFKETELELIGVPKTTDTINPVLDDDLGRYYVFNTEERKHFFKTPTIRNISLTAPYMHNGVYNTLEEVLDFYNKGGGGGLGIEITNQTLPKDHLNLSKKEIKNIIAFLNSLSDENYETNQSSY